MQRKLIYAAILFSIVILLAGGIYKFRREIIAQLSSMQATKVSSLIDDRVQKELRKVHDDVTKAREKHVSLVGSNFLDVGNFELTFRYRLKPGGHFTLVLRNSAEVDFGDQNTGSYAILADGHGSGQISSNTQNQHIPVIDADKPIGQWNDAKIILIGEMLSVHLNGKQVHSRVSLEDKNWSGWPVPARGLLRILADPDLVIVQNIKLSSWPLVKTFEYLSKPHNADQKPMFNGKNLDNWIGKLATYEVVDQEIRSKPSPYGAIYFKPVLQNYRARFEFKLPKGGNNGIALRYPGFGRHSMTGLELQILDDHGDKHKNLDPRQLHGSVYGLVPAFSGYLNKPGSWNWQEIVYSGTKIRVRLNGFTILDTDLANVTTSIQKTLPSGLKAIEGRFGLLGHGDKVSFRNLRYSHLP